MDLTFGSPGRYRVCRKIGDGSFGEVFLAHNLMTGEQVAIKLERDRTEYQLLSHEACVYRCLTGIPGVPSLRWFGIQHGYNALVLDLYGPSLEDLFNFCDRKFSLKTVLLIADQLLISLEQIHARDHIHRDIKPENLLIGLGQLENQVFLVDFGLSKRYRHIQTRVHNSYRDSKTLTGTARYASLNSHRGIEQSRRDDIAAVAYMLIYFLRGGLPWQGVKAPTKQERYNKILELKESIPVRFLCGGLPSEFAFLITYAHTMKYFDRPNYAGIRQVFRNLFLREGFSDQPTFDWTLRMLQTGQTSVPTRKPTRPWYPKPTTKATPSRPLPKNSPPHEKTKDEFDWSQLFI